MQGPIIVTAHRVRGGQLKAWCPLCGLTHEIKEATLGGLFVCPVKDTWLKINSFVIEPLEFVHQSVQPSLTPVMDIPLKKTDIESSPPSMRESSVKIQERYGVATPQDMLDGLNKAVIGQEKAKKAVAQAIYYHMLTQRLMNNGMEIQSQGPIMLAGATGTGKTFIIQKACQFAELPFIHVDTSSMVEEGIVGFSINDLGKEILRVSGGNIETARFAVVFFDESDKLLDTHFGASVTSQLLRLMEGTDIRLSMNKDETLSAKTLPTHRMLFFLGGAFQSLVDNRLKRGAIGFCSWSVPSMTRPEQTLLAQSGFPKEFAGRIRNVVVMDRLSEGDLYEILVRSEASPLKDYIALIKECTDEVHVEDGALKEIARIAHELGYGARSLRQVLHRVFSPFLFAAPSWQGRKPVRITINDVKTEVEAATQ